MKRFRNQRYKKLLSILFLSLMLSGCASRREGSQLFAWKEQEARLYDIPIMIGAVPDYTYQQNTEGLPSCIAYTVRASCGLVQGYYTQDMERYGWRSCVVIQGYENMLVFEKPQRLCIISLRPFARSDQTKVIITQAFLE